MSRIYQEAWDHWHTDDPVCPHCGEIVCDAWELFVHDANEVVEEWECIGCNKPYRIERHIDVSYSTMPIAKTNGDGHE